MEIKQYVFLLRRWLWILILGLVLGSASAYIASRMQNPIYASSAKVMVVQNSNRDQTAYTDFLSGQQLVQTYSELLITDPILNEVSTQIGLPIKAKNITVQQIRDTLIFSVTVEYGDPNIASFAANMLIDQLVVHNEELQSSRFSSSEESLKSQIDVVQSQISDLETELNQVSKETLDAQILKTEEQISALQAEIIDIQLEINAITLAPTLSVDDNLATPEVEMDSTLNQKQYLLEQRQGMLDLFEEIYLNLLANSSNGEVVSGGSGNSQYHSTLALYQQIYANLISDYESVRLARYENTPIIVNVESATPNSDPIRPKISTNTLLGAVVGLMLAGGIVFLIEYLDDTVKTPEDVRRKVDEPIIGYIPEIEGGKNKDLRTIDVQNNPRSPIAEAFRTLRTNIEFEAIENPLKTIVVTSPGPQEGKSTVSANLAAVMAQGGNRVVLIDADLRRPVIHRYFNLENRVGIGEYFSNQATLEEIVFKDDDTNINLILSGKLPPNPTEILSSQKMNALLEYFKTHADYIIIDSPPAVVADPIVLSAKADGVLMVVYPEKTRLNGVSATSEQLKRANANLFGIVLTNITKQASYYYRSYYANYYPSAYYHSEE